jgi:iron complex transport system substrate-binding protein
LRIVSLAPSATEILFALGLQDSIVGVTDRCDYPPEAKNIERVGGLGAPNIEKLLAIRPDLVIATGLEPGNASWALRQSGIRLLELKVRNFQEMFGAFREIGRAVGKPERASQVVAAMEADLEAVTKQYNEIPLEQRPRVFVEIWHHPITTAGGASFLDEVVTRAGGTNVAHDLRQPYPRVNPEQVIQWNPDVILLCYMDAQAVKVNFLADRIGWSGIAAVRSGRIIADISPDLLLRPGPRLIQGVKALAERLYEHRRAE